MQAIIDGVRLDEHNEEFNYAQYIVENTDNPVFLTGRAGTGKTTFLKFIREQTGLKTVVLAPTGVAALNARGQTIHSFFKIPPKVFTPDDPSLRLTADDSSADGRTVYDTFKYSRPHKKLIAGMELLIIDEVSMVRCDLLDTVDKILRAVRMKHGTPFGGVKLLLIGDPFQLPPVIRPDVKAVLDKFYDSPFFFSALSYKESRPLKIELKKIYRQSNARFIELLNNIRINRVTPEDMELLNGRFIPSEAKNENSERIIIATHNDKVDTTNNYRLDALPGSERLYRAETSGTFPEGSFPADENLRLKPGARVMFVRNDPEKRYYNGKICTVKELYDEEISVLSDDGFEMRIGRCLWENIIYSWNDKEKKIDEETVGSFEQFPLKPAWAVTVHKSQGLTFEKILADLAGSFSPGQVYVALSRCTSLEGLLLKSRIPVSAIKTDPRVVKFAEED